MEFGKNEKGEWALLMGNADEIDMVCHGFVERLEGLQEELHGQGEEDLGMAERAHIVTEIEKLWGLIEPMQAAVRNESNKGNDNG